MPASFILSRPIPPRFNNNYNSPASDNADLVVSTESIAIYGFTSPSTRQGKGRRLLQKIRNRFNNLPVHVIDPGKTGSNSQKF